VKGKLFLLPNLLHHESPADSIPEGVLQTTRGLAEFIVESEKSARAFLKKTGIITPQAELIFHILDEQTKPQEIETFLDNAEKGGNIGLLSDAGLPCVADPGAEIVSMAHRRDIQVVPFTGPSSIMLALMASGFNGQNFCFHGYIPIDRDKRSKKIKEMERASQQLNQTQIFIETPYRNQQMLQALTQACNPSTWLCIAADLVSATEFIQSKPISAWKGQQQDLHKRPAIFLLYSPGSRR
jgi:16S rRNA (cytidine1402-2'-O)-methyltransferase